MPRINRARVVNIRYDEGNKAYLDQIFDFRGKNGIVLLENGGGKSLLVQLLLQVIIPNTRMNKRLFRELFSPGQTSHLMIEWLTDGPGTEYVLTGLTAMLPRDRDSLRDFSYIHRYSEPDPFDLDRIPVIRNRRVTRYTDFRSLLRSSGRDIHIHDTREDYERDLATYNIFPSEWDAIRRANDEEGRTEGFFDGATTVSRLFRGILIPAVVNILYPGGEHVEVARVFAELRDKLVNIPRYRDELDELEKMRHLIEGIRDEIAEYGRLSGLHEESLVDIDRFYRTLEEAVPAKERVAAGLKENIEAHQRRGREMEFELDCLEVDEGRLRLEALEENKGRVVSEKARAEKERDLVQGRKRLLEAGDLKQGVLDKERDRDRVRVLLEVEEEKVEDLAAELRDLRRTQLQLLPAEIGRARDSIDALQGELDDRLSEVKETRNARNRIRGEIGQLQEQRGALRDRIERANRMGREIEKSLGWETWMRPAEALEERRALLKSVEEEHEGQEKTIAAARQETEHLREQVAQWTFEMSRAVSGRQRIEARIEGFEKERADLQAALVPYVEGERRLDDLHSAALMMVLEGERKDIGRQLEEATVRYHESRASLSRLEAEEGYVPNSDMVAVRDTLAELGIAAVFGGQLVRSQRLSEEEQLAVLQRHPLLPYGLLITADDLRILSADPGVLNEMSLEAPVPLFTNRETLLFGGQGMGGLVSIGDGYAHLTGNRSFPLHVSEEDLQGHQRALKSGAQDSGERMDLLREAIEGLGEVILRLRGFQHRYPVEYAAVQEREMARVTGEISCLEERAREAQARIEELGLVERKAAEERVSLQGRLDRLRGEISEIEAYLPVRSEREESQERLGEVNDSLGVKGSDLEAAEERERVLSESIRETGVDLDARGEELAGLQRSLGYLEDRDLGEGDPVAGTYEEITDRIEAVEKTLDGTGAAGYRQTVDVLTEQIGDLEGRIRALGFDPGDVVQRQVQPSVLKGLQERIRVLGAVLDSLEERIGVLQGDIREEMGEIREKCRRIQDRYGRQPPESITVRSVEEARVRLQESISRIKESRVGLEGELDVETRLVKEWREVARRARTVLQRAEFEIAPGIEPLAGVPGDPRRHLENLEDRERDLEGQLQRQRYRVADAYRETSRDGRYRHEVTREVFSTVRQLPEEMLYDPATMQSRFEEFFVLLEKSREVLEENLRILEEDRLEVERKALREAERLLGELNQIQGYSRFRLRGRRTYTVRIDLRAGTEEERVHRMQRYVERSVTRLEDLEESAVDEFVRDRFSPLALVDAIAPVDGYTVEILKPQRPSERANYVAWESVPKWSGGEKFTAYFMMLVTLLSYLRAKRVPEYASGKVLIADNPFGRASSPHLLEIVFGLAQETETQMICLTALRERAIYDNFPVVYSLKLRRAQGRQYVEVGDDSVLPEGSAVISSAQYGLFDERIDDDG